MWRLVGGLSSLLSMSLQLCIKGQQPPTTRLEISDDTKFKTHYCVFFYSAIAVTWKQVTFSVRCLCVVHYNDDSEGEALQHFGN